MSTGSDHRYRVVYHVEHNAEGLLQSELPKGSGGADGIVIVSVMGRSGEREPYSIALATMRGETGAAMKSHELFQIWTLIANQLAKDESLGAGSRAVCTIVDDLMRQAIASRLAELGATVGTERWERLPDIQAHLVQKQCACPDCGAGLTEGPHGGLSVNWYCTS